MTDVNVHDHVGGHQFFVALVDRFYEGVEHDEALRPMYPEDLEPGKEALAYFLAQYWGGPPIYSEHKGHPRLRMRHVNFRITEVERDRWYLHMSNAVTAADLDDPTRQRMLDYFAMAADHLVNAS